jgi:dTMP kinase
LKGSLKLIKLSKLQGKFITFEGGEGTGKTTCSGFLKSLFDRQHIPAIKTFDPGGCQTAQKIRKILLSKDSKFDAMAEVFLFFAARIQLENEIILPALEDGTTVICDRWFDSTLVYQCMCKGNDIDIVKSLYSNCCRCTPDYTFLLDVDAKIGLQRSYNVLSEQNVDESRFEDYGLAFHENVRKNFLELYHDKVYNQNRIKLVDANGTLRDSQKQILKIVEEI